METFLIFTLTAPFLKRPLYDEREKKPSEYCSLLLPMAEIKPRLPAQQASALSITPLPLGVILLCFLCSDSGDRHLAPEPDLSPGVARLHRDRAHQRRQVRHLRRRRRLLRLRTRGGRRVDGRQLGHARLSPGLLQEPQSCGQGSVQTEQHLCRSKLGPELLDPGSLCDSDIADLELWPVRGGQPEPDEPAPQRHHRRQQRSTRRNRRLKIVIGQKM